MPKMSKRSGLNVARSAGGERAKNAWSALLSDSDSETDAVVPATPVKKPTAREPVAPKKMPRVEEPIDLQTAINLLADDPFLQKMTNGEILWGDLMYAPPAATTPDPEPVFRGSEAEFWSFPWAFKLQEQIPDLYETTELSDAEYNAMMSWLYEKGWWVGDYERSWVSFEPDNLPSRRWCPPSDEAPRKTLEARYRPTALDAKVVSFGPSSCCGGHSHGHKKEKKASSQPAKILRFCRATPCTEEGCNYVHEDTIPRVDRPCAFGERCGATDPTGLKRSQCLYMHPGETWSADLVIRRPVPVEPTAAEEPATL